MGNNKSLCTIKLQNLFINFPGIKVQKQINDTPRQIQKFHYCQSLPKVRQHPRLIALSKKVIQMMKISYQDIKNDANCPLFLSGSKLIQNSIPICNNYYGYQFGVWAGQLGDGRAHTIGQTIINNKLFELQLKGSGITPFSRHADGNSVLSSALRQFLASQLMFGLNIPTTRAASLVITKQLVRRDPLYNGNIKIQPAAIVLRICQCFLRFGSFQICDRQANLYDQNPLQNRKKLIPLLDFLLKYCYPQIQGQECDPYEQIFQKIVIKSAQLVANWQATGFVHGVLNTDNMSMVNLTIDYGPFAFIDYFSKDFVSNATDEHERYSYRRQPDLVKWNLQKLAQSFDVIIPATVLKKYINQNYQITFKKKYYSLMCKKIGLVQSQQANFLVDQLIEVMHKCSSHFTNVFRILSQSNFNKEQIEQLSIKLQGQSCPTQFYLKNIRAFPTLIGVDYSKMIKYDSGFNTFFIDQQEERFDILQKLKQENCKERYQRQKKLWSQWLQKYISLKPAIQKGKTVQYVLLNEIAKSINSQLLSLKQQEQLPYMQKILQVFYNPFQKNQWFQKNYWSLKPTPVKLTCSS